MRSSWWAVVVAALAAPGAASAQGDDLAGVEIKVIPVSKTLFLLEGAGGNIGVSAGEDGILIVDDQLAPLAPRIKAALKGIVDRPVRFVLNTHFHHDHTGGNPAFAEGGAEVIAHHNVRQRLAAARKEAGTPVSILPVLTFGDSLSVHFNGEEIRALHTPRGHTDGDAIIYFVGSRVVHLGDQLFSGRFPYIDQDSGGSVSGSIANLERVLRELPADTRVMSGHSPLGTLDQVREALKLLKETRAVVAAAVKKGRTLEQLKSAKVLARWDRYAWDFVSADAWLETLYRDVQGPRR